MLGFLVMLLIAALVGFVGDAMVPGTIPGGWVGAIIAGLVGSAVGGYLCGVFHLLPGPAVGGFAIVPSIVGAGIVVWLYGLISGQTSTRRGV